MASELFVPNVQLQAGQIYTFAVTLQNFLGFSSTSAPYTVTVAAGSIPNVLITAGSSYVASELSTTHDATDGRLLFF